MCSQCNESFILTANGTCECPNNLIVGNDSMCGCEAPFVEQN